METLVFFNNLAEKVQSGVKMPFFMFTNIYIFLSSSSIDDYTGKKTVIVSKRK